MVISPAKLEANRRNATKSTGPRSQQGKAVVAKNATKHGLLSQNPPLLATEDLETFQGLVQSLVDDYQPQSPVEWHLLQTVAMCIQRQHRLWQAEAALLNEQLLPVIPEPDIDEKYPWQIERERVQAQQQYEQQLQQRRELTAMRLTEKIHLLGAYETRINRQLYEAIDRLETLRYQRNE